MGGVEDVRELLDRGVTAIVAAVHAGDVDPVQLAEIAVQRAAEAPANALVRVDGGVAVAHARQLAARLAAGERPPLAGVPVAHKDLLDTVDFPTTYGNRNLEVLPRRDATAVARTVSAGVIQVGKANLDEIAYGVTGRNEHLGDVAHPTVPGHLTGGSSSGSAAVVAAGVVVASLGTDTGGSVRIPAACCGVVGLKTTQGCVPSTGIQPLSWPQDTVGPIAARVDDAAQLLAVVAGADGRDPIARDAPDGWQVWPIPEELPRHVLVAPRLWETRIDARVADVCRGALEALGVTEAVTVDRIDDARRAQAVILAANAYAVHSERLEADPSLYGAAARSRLERGGTIRADVLARALRMREEWRADLGALLRPGTVIASPTVGFPPPRTDAEVVVWPDGEEDVTPALTRLTGIWNLAGLPAVSVPAGTVDGLPVGLQLVGAAWSEPLLLAAARAIESARS